VHDAATRVDEQHVEGQVRILHPHADALRFVVDENHRLIVGERGHVHEAAGARIWRVRPPRRVFMAAFCLRLEYDAFGRQRIEGGSRILPEHRRHAGEQDGKCEYGSAARPARAAHRSA
jgi:hypothetical protein